MSVACHRGTAENRGPGDGCACVARSRCGPGGKEKGTRDPDFCSPRSTAYADPLTSMDPLSSWQPGSVTVLIPPGSGVWVGCDHSVPGGVSGPQGPCPKDLSLFQPRTPPSSGLLAWHGAADFSPGAGLRTMAEIRPEAGGRHGR